MGVTSRVAARRILRNEPLITISGQAPKESSVTHAALAIQRQLHAVRVRNNIAVVARAAVARIFSELGMRFEIICTAVEIGRASCRERVYIAVVGGSVTKTV